MAIEKKIIVTTDSSQAESSFSRTSSSIEGMLNKVAESVSNVSSKVSGLVNSLLGQDTSTKSVFDNMVRGAERVATTHAERVAHIEKELQLLARVNQETQKTATNEAGNDLKTKLSGDKLSPTEKKAYKDEHAERLKEIKEQAERTKKEYLALQALKAQYESQTYSTDSSQQATTPPNSAANGTSGTNTQTGNQTPPISPVGNDVGRVDDANVIFDVLVKESEKHTDNAKERIEYIEKELKLLRQINKEESLRSEIESRQKLDEDLSKLGAGEVDKQRKAKEAHKERMARISTESKQQQHQAMILERLSKRYADEQEDDSVPPPKPPVPPVSNTKSPAGRAMGIGKTIGAAALGAAGFGAILSIGGFIGNLVDQADQLGKAEARMGATGFKSGSVAGLKRAEEIDYSRNIALAMGRGDVANEVTKQGILERGTGMDLGSTSRFNTVMRSDKEQRTLTDATVEMLNIMKSTGLYNIDKDDFTMLNELMSRSNELNSIQSNQANMIDSSRTNSLLAAFGSMGGSFGDQRQTGTIAGLNQDIRGGGNEFTNAFMMRSIVNNDPNATLWDTMKAKDEGIFKEGQFANIVGDVFSSFKGDDQKFNLKALFPSLNYSQVDELHKQFEADPEKFKKIESTKQLEEMLNLEGIQSRGGVGELEGWKSDFDDSMSKMGDVAIKKISEYIDAFKSGDFDALTAKFSQDIHKAISSAFEYGVRILKEEITPSVEESVEEFKTTVKLANSEEGRVLLNAASESGSPEMKFMSTAYKILGMFISDDPAQPAMKGNEASDETNKLLREQNEMMRKGNKGMGDGSMLMTQPNTPTPTPRQIVPILSNVNLQSTN